MPPDAARSALMRRIRRSGTAPELAARRVVNRIGLRYRVDVRSLPGSPDLANKARRWVVFVHGCFWHRHPGCPRATTPKTNVRFWKLKFDDNVRRDAAKVAALKTLGYAVTVIWECETLDERKLAKRIQRSLKRAAY